MTFEEMAWEFVEVFEELDTDQINEMLVKNVPLDTIEFVVDHKILGESDSSGFLP